MISRMPVRGKLTHNERVLVELLEEGLQTENIRYFLQSYLAEGGRLNTLRNSTGETLLHMSVKYSGPFFYKLLLYLLTTGVIPRNEADYEERTILHKAAYMNNCVAIGIACNKMRQDALTKFIDASDVRGNTALHCAASAGSYKAFIALALHGADIAEKNSEGKFPRDISQSTVILNFLQKFEMMFDRLENNYEFCTEIDHFSGSELLAAIMVKKHGRTIVQKLMFLNPSANVLTMWDSLWARLYKEFGVIYKLGDDYQIGQDYETILRNLGRLKLALERLETFDQLNNANKNYSDVFKQLKILTESSLLDYFVKTNFVNYKGERMLDPFAQLIMDVMIMLEPGVVGQKKLAKAYDILDWALKIPVSLLLEKLEFTYLVKFIESNSLVKVRKLLQQEKYINFIVNKTAANNQTVLHIAVFKDLSTMCDLILDRLTTSAKLILLESKTKDYGYTALHIAVIKKSIDIVWVLMKYGATYNARSNNQKTPLMLATKCEIVSTLNEAAQLRKSVKPRIRLLNIFRNSERWANHLHSIHRQSNKKFLALCNNNNIEGKTLLNQMNTPTNQVHYNQFQTLADFHMIMCKNELEACIDGLESKK